MLIARKESINLRGGRFARQIPPDSAVRCHCLSSGGGQCYDSNSANEKRGQMEKKNFLFVSLTGLIGDKKERDIADGFVAKSKDWEKDKDWADIIVFDDTLGQGEKAQALRKEGKKVIGGTAYGDKLEDDRSFGQEELKKAGVNIIPYAE